jgi:trimethylamine--corrinoid protein Co-methyltransferase
MKYDYRIISRECVDAMLSSALRMIDEIGIETSRKDLLDRARGLAGLRVSGNRIFVAPDVALEVIKQNQVNTGDPSPRPEHPKITVPESASLFADHHARVLRPMTRADVIAGTKLLDGLTPRWVIGKAAGTPQDTIPPMRPLEQYVIGFRHSRHRGVTRVPLTKAEAPFLSEMREIAEGFDPKRRDFSVWVPSPLRLEGNELDDLLDSGAQVSSFYVGSMPVMGLTGPADPIGVYTLSLAETLGGAAILHRVFPEAKASLYPHPQPMDPRSGLMAFGTPEWNHLELMKKELFEHLGMPPKPKENLTSACMPDSQAQADKMASIAFGVAHGFTHFNLFPLCADEAWSHAQLVLDVEYVHVAWRTQKPVSEKDRASEAFDMVERCLREGMICGEVRDSVRHLRENYYLSPIPRVFSSGQWNGAGRPDVVSDAEAYAHELISNADYAPQEDKFRKVMGVYRRACRAFGAEPMNFD